MKYKRLYAEMFVKGITKKDIGKLLNRSESTINNRLNGKPDFAFSEAMKIRKEFFKELTPEYLFYSERVIKSEK